MLQEFENNKRLFDVYIKIKALKDLLGAETKSYFVKKVLLRPNFKAITDGGFHLPGRLLFTALTLPELRGQFEHLIDFERWQNEIKHDPFAENIPLLRTA